MRASPVVHRRVRTMKLTERCPFTLKWFIQLCPFGTFSISLSGPKGGRGEGTQDTGRVSLGTGTPCPESKNDAKLSKCDVRLVAVFSGIWAVAQEASVFTGGTTFISESGADKDIYLKLPADGAQNTLIQHGRVTLYSTWSTRKWKTGRNGAKHDSWANENHFAPLIIHAEMELFPTKNVPTNADSFSVDCFIWHDLCDSIYSFKWSQTNV